MRFFITTVCLLAAFQSGARPADPFFLRDGQRVVFLGDSNTFAGLFVAYIDSYLFTRFPDQKFELINLGLPSETVSGLSEPDHPYPRPDVHERLDRALAKTKPDVVIACYGMNDGIYYPFSEERFRKYQEGIRKLIARVRKAGAKVVLMTPAPFDPKPVKDKLLPRSAEKFSWVHPYEGYDEVLTRYSEWLLTLRGEGFIVADPHTAINRYLARVRRSEPGYRVSGDGIHPDATGHWLIAQELLLALKAPAEADAAVIDLPAEKVVRGKVDTLRAKDGMIQFAWTSRLPLAEDPKWDRRLAEAEHFSERLNRYRLTVRGAERERYELLEGARRLGEVSGKDLADGVDLLRFKDLSTNRRAAEVAKLALEREQLLGLAWPTDVGHKRPDTPKGLPLDDARKRAERIEAEVRKLSRPVPVELRLRPFGK